MSTLRLTPPDPSLSDPFAEAIRSLTAMGPETLPEDPAGRYPILAAWDRLGLADRAAEVLLGYGRTQGFFGGFGGGSDPAVATGAALWSLVDHARITGDLVYLKRVYRLVRRGLRWIARRRRPDGTEAHSGLISWGSDDPRPYYAPSIWALAGAQEAARAAVVLGRRGHQHDAEALFYELNRAIQESLRKQAASGASGPPGLTPPEELIALTTGGLFPPDFAPIGTAAEYALAAGLGYAERSALGRLLLQRGDPRVWEVVDALASEPLPDDAVPLALFLLLMRSLLVSDQRNLLLVAPGSALRPIQDGGVIGVESAPTLHGPLTYRLERRGTELLMSWEPLVRSIPEHFIWPLPGKVWKLEPPRAALTESRRAIRLDPGGGHLTVELVKGSLEG